jgi:hypothetical protein
MLNDTHSQETILVEEFIKLENLRVQLSKRMPSLAYVIWMVNHQGVLCITIT